MAKKKTTASGISDLEKLFLDEKVLTVDEVLQVQEEYRVYSTGCLALDLAIGKRDPLKGNYGIPERTILEHFGMNQSLKCFGKDTEILMYDGTIKKVQDIEVGDLLMGPDSKPRKVTELHSGTDELFKIIPVKGSPWVCNKGHIMSLMRTRGKVTTKRIRGSERRTYSVERNEIVNLPLSTYMQLPEHLKKSSYRLYKPGLITFPRTMDKLPIEPYYLGLWLGDGSSSKGVIHNTDREVRDYLQGYSERLGVKLVNNEINPSKCPALALTEGRESKASRWTENKGITTKLKNLEVLHNKHIPHLYLTSSEEDRLNLLAGLLDSDGYRQKKCNSFVIVQKDLRLIEQIKFLALSLGFSVTLRPTKHGCWYKGVKREGLYHTMRISGKDLSRIPVRIARKTIETAINNQANLLACGFEVEPIGVGNFYGFTVEGPNNRFLLSDFTVVHNTATYEQLAKNILADDPENRVIILYSEESDMTRWTKIGVPIEHQKRILALGCYDGSNDENLETAERCLDKITVAVQDPRVKLVVVDSIKALPLRNQILGEDGQIKSLSDKEQLGMQAVMIKKFLLEFKVCNKKAILYMTNQVADRITVDPSSLYPNYRFTKKTPGGRAMEFECMLRIEGETRPYEVDKHELTGEEILEGWNVSFRILKNKFCNKSANRVAMARFIFDPSNYEMEYAGFDQATAILTIGEYLTRKGIIKAEEGVNRGGGGFYTISGEKIRGEKNARKAISTNQELRERILQQIYDNADKVYDKVKDNVEGDIEGEISF